MADYTRVMIDYLDDVAEAVRTGGAIADGTNFAEGDHVVLSFRLGHGPARDLVVAYPNVAAVIETLKEAAHLLTTITFEPVWSGDASVVSQLIDVA